jgi:hypothetical protein
MAAMEITPDPQVNPVAEPLVPREPRRFGASERALQQRRLLILGVKGLALACLGVLLLIFQPPVWWAELLKWTVAAALGWGLWRMKGAALLDPLHQRHLLLHEHAIELNRAGFRRFVVFESLQHVQLIQGRDERLVALVLHTADDSVVLRDTDGLGEIFAAVSIAKPPTVFIEVVHKPVDWGEPLPWALTLGAVVLILCFLFWIAPWSKQAYAKGNGRLLVLNGAVLAFWRPSSRKALWYQQIPEVLVGGLFFLFGQLFLR